MPVAAAHLLEFPLPEEEIVFGNQRFPLDNVGRYYGKPHWSPNSDHIRIPRFFRKKLSCQEEFSCTGRIHIANFLPGSVLFFINPTDLLGRRQ